MKTRGINFKIIVLVLIGLFGLSSRLSAQYFMEMYEYAGTDSAAKALVQVCAYNSHDRLSTKTLYTYNRSRTDTAKQTSYYEYRSNGVLDHVLSTSADSSRKTVYSYTPQGQISKESEYVFKTVQKKTVSDWMLNKEKTFRYDKNGMRTDGKHLPGEVKNAYNDDNSLKETRYYNAQGKLLWTEEYSRTSSAYETEYTYDGATRMVVVLEQYNNALRTTYNDDGSTTVTKTVTKLDGDGRAIERSVYDSADVLQSFTVMDYYDGPVEFFKQRNFITKLVTFNAQKQRIKTIIYKYSQAN